ncbi:hypothetical protein [Cupriavidus necator]
MDFFAIVGGHALAVYRIELHQELQSHLDQMFRAHADQLWCPDLVVVPFERENFHPDETEILEIEPFDLPEFIYEPLQNPVGWPVLPLDDDTLSRVYCVFAYDATDEEIIFQVITKSQRLSRTNMNIVLRNNVFTKLADPGLVLAGACHAVYQDNALRFKSMWWLKQIIDIGDYYRAATEADVERFSEIPSVRVENLEALKRKSGQWVRTRVAYILDSGVLEAFTPQQLAQKAAEFGVTLNCVNEDGLDKLVIPEAPKDLRAALKFLEEEYYAGPITGAAYEANSKRRRGD